MEREQDLKRGLLSIPIPQRRWQDVLLRPLPEVVGEIVLDDNGFVQTPPISIRKTLFTVTVSRRKNGSRGKYSRGMERSLS